MRMTNPDDTPTRCQAIKANGERCRCTLSVRESDGRFYCPSHDPKRREKMQRARARGGRVTGGINKDRWTRTVSEAGMLDAPRTAADCVEWSSWVTHAVAVGIIDRATAREVNNGIKVLLTSLEKSEIEGKVAELSRKLEALKAGSAA